ncbi:MAG: hypothetical protein PHN93_09565, partial [Sphaerochaetaceae bacterium]|nr:hypothetical protein [Sphaerochaetaceae bacterium]
MPHNSTLPRRLLSVAILVSDPPSLPLSRSSVSRGEQVNASRHIQDIPFSKDGRILLVLPIRASIPPTPNAR